MRKMIKINEGDRFGKFSIIKEIDPIYGYANKMIRLFECKCDCGNISIVRLGNLRNGSSKSCGCLKIDIVTRVASKHRQARDNNRTTEYACWLNLKQRCTNPKNISWKYYGERGIKMCDKWFNSFKAFYDDIGKKPEKRYSIDRINNEGNYEPGNCRWATPSEQRKNQRKRTKV